MSGKVISRRLSGPQVSCGVWARPLGYGVIGNTTVSGTVILGSSPGIPALKTRSIGARHIIHALLDELVLRLKTAKSVSTGPIV